MALHAMCGQMIKDGFGPPGGEDDKTESWKPAPNWKPAPKKGAKSARKANAVALAAQAVADGGSDSDSDEDGDGNAGAGAAVGAAAATNNAVAKVDWAALGDESIEHGCSAKKTVCFAECWERCYRSQLVAQQWYVGCSKCSL